MYGVLPYFLSRNIVEIPFLVLLPSVYILLVYWMFGFANTALQFFTMYLILFLISFTGTSLGLLIGSVFNDEKGVNLATPILVLPLVVLSGFYKNSANIPKWFSWIQYISPIKYGFIGMLNN